MENSRNQTSLVADVNVEAADLPLQKWYGAFGPLVLAEERKRRGHLLAQPDRLTDYVRITLEAAVKIDEEAVTIARKLHEVVDEHTIHRLDSKVEDLRIAEIVRSMTVIMRKLSK